MAKQHTMQERLAQLDERRATREAARREKEEAAAARDRARGR